MQYLGCQLHTKNAFGGSLRELASPDSHSRYKGKGRERKRRKRLGIGREEREGKQRMGRDERVEGGLDLDICPGSRVPSYATAQY